MKIYKRQVEYHLKENDICWDPKTAVIRIVRISINMPQIR